MILQIFFALLLTSAVWPGPVIAATHHPKAAANSAQLAQFDTDTAARAQCPRDQVVWLNTNSGIYHEGGLRWYGRTKFGAYVSRKKADAASDRGTRNR
ncbi:MAG TPA: hypothetical protein VGC72_04680 [Candidatus Elarobacter sp.]|jgi:hypothetical protein